MAPDVGPQSLSFGKERIQSQASNTSKSFFGKSQRALAGVARSVGASFCHLLRISNHTTREIGPISFTRQMSSWADSGIDQFQVANCKIKYKTHKKTRYSTFHFQSYLLPLTCRLSPCEWFLSCLQWQSVCHRLWRGVCLRIKTGCIFKMRVFSHLSRKTHQSKQRTFW